MIAMNELISFVDGDIALVSLFQKHKEAQAEFKEVHKQVDKIRGNTLNPTTIQRELEQVESEREQIIAKLAKLREKVTGDSAYSHVNFDDILAVHSVHQLPVSCLNLM